MTSIGIDLGTTYSGIAECRDDGTVSMVPNQQGATTTPSAVYFNADRGSVVVGEKAKELGWIDPVQIAMFAKRDMGSSAAHVRYDPREKGYRPWHYWGRDISPEEISSYVLAALKRDAERVVGSQIREAVVSVPAYFGESQKEATRKAAELAGIQVLELIPEPTAAALRYACGSTAGRETIMVFDLGGGTFDVTILESRLIAGQRTIKVLATKGDRRLGGKDWDETIVSYCCHRFERQTGINLFREPLEQRVKCLGELQLAAEKAKQELSIRESTTILMGYGGQKDTITLTREEFEHKTAELVNRCRVFCEEALAACSLRWQDLDVIIPAGSMTKVPSVLKSLEGWAGKAVKPVLVDPKTAVAEGAAIHAYLLRGGKCIAAEPPRNLVAEHFGVVARNAQGQQVVKHIIKAGDEYPLDRTATFRARQSGAGQIDIDIVEGNSQVPEQCDQLGTVVLEQGHLTQAGAPLEVTLCINSSGILSVHARDLSSGTEVQAEVRRRTALQGQALAEAQAALDDLFLG